MTYEDRTTDLADFVKGGKPLGTYPAVVKGLMLIGYTHVLNEVPVLISLETRINSHVGMEKWSCDGLEYTHTWKSGGETEETTIADPLLLSLVKHLFFLAEKGLERDVSGLKLIYRPCQKTLENEPNN